MRIAKILAVGMRDFSKSPNIEDPRVVAEFEASPDSRWAAGDYAILTLPELAARDATNIVRWSDEDKCYVAELRVNNSVIMAHGDTREKAWEEFKTAFELVLAAEREKWVKQGHGEAAKGILQRLGSACLTYRHDCGLMPSEEQAQLLCTAQDWAEAFAKEISALSPAVPALEEVRAEARLNAERRVIGNVAARWLEEYGTVESVESEVVYDWLRALIGKEG